MTMMAILLGTSKFRRLPQTASTDGFHIRHPPSAICHQGVSPEEARQGKRGRLLDWRGQGKASRSRPGQDARLVDRVEGRSLFGRAEDGFRFCRRPPPSEEGHVDGRPHPVRRTVARIPVGRDLGLGRGGGLRRDVSAHLPAHRRVCPPPFPLPRKGKGAFLLPLLLTSSDSSPALAAGDMCRSIEQLQDIGGELARPGSRVTNHIGWSPDVSPRRRRNTRNARCA